MTFGVVMFASSLRLSLRKKWSLIIVVVTCSFLFLMALMLVDMSLVNIGWFGALSTGAVFTMFTMVGMTRVVEVAFVIVHKISFRMQIVSHPVRAL